jgi:hypothetical protein
MIVTRAEFDEVLRQMADASKRIAHLEKGMIDLNVKMNEQFTAISYVKPRTLSRITNTNKRAYNI